jgi:hypothetical protein
MKTRNGFVSNSSSSSFVIGIPKKCFSKYDPKEITQWELCNYLYPENSKIRKEGIFYEYNDGRTKVGVYSVCTIIAMALKGQKPLTKAQAAKEVSHGGFKGMPSWTKARKLAEDFANKYAKETNSSIYHLDDKAPDAIAYRKLEDKGNREYGISVKKAAKKLVDEMWPKFKGMKVFVIEFSDNDGDLFAMLEHGNTFSKVPHIKVSHH